MLGLVGVGGDPRSAGCIGNWRHQVPDLYQQAASGVFSYGKCCVPRPEVPRRGEQAKTTGGVREGPLPVEVWHG